MPDSGFDVEARYASLDERVRNQGTQITALEQEMRRSFSVLSTALDNINSKLSETNKPQWQALGVMLTAVVVVGSLAYWPIRETQQRIESDITSFMSTMQQAIDTTNKRFDNFLSLQQFSEFKNTYENNRALARVDTNARFEKVERRLESSISREEHARILENINQRFIDMQRQVDQNTATNAAVYTPRDQLLQLTKELEELKKLNSGS